MASSHIETLLVIGGLVQRAYGRRLLRHILSRILVVSGLTIIFSIIVSALLLGSVYVAYGALLASGIASHVAMSLVMVALVIVSLVLVLLIVQALRRMPRSMTVQSQLGAEASRVADAFFDGLNTNTPR